MSTPVPTPAVDSAAPPAAAGPLAGRRVLVVDDCPDGLFILSRLLEAAGAEVAGRPHGVAGLAAWQAAAGSGRPFDAVVLDQRLPGMRGTELAATLRGAGFGGAIAVVSAYPSEGAEDLWLAAGCDAVLAKGDCPAKLVAALAAARRAG